MKGASQRIALLARSARHIPPGQLAARVRLSGKRRAVGAAAGRMPPRHLVAAAEVPPFAEVPPQPVFASRVGLVDRTAQQRVIRLPGATVPLTLPLEWHPPELAYGTRLPKLHLHYMEFLEELDDRTACAAVADWIAANARRRPDYWMDAWNSYALSIRVVVWMQERARGRLRADPELEDVLWRSVVAQLRFLERNLEFDIGGNHLVRNIRALLWAGAFFGGAEARRWRRRGRELLRRELGRQVLPDGLHYERSPAYHLQVLSDLLECHAASDPADRAEQVPELHRMAQALVDMTHPDGNVSLFNDGALNMSHPPAACLEAFERLTGERVTARASFALAAAGYYGHRADAGSLVLLDCGEVGPPGLPAHSHADILSFEWSTATRRVIVDHGVFEYNAGPRRAYSRGTPAHNTVTVGDADQCEPWLAFRMGRRAAPVVHSYQSRDDGFVLEGSHDGYRSLLGAPRHRRRFACSPAGIAVYDTVTGGAGQPVRARLLLHPDFTALRTAEGARLSDGEFTVLLATGAEVKVADASWCPRFGERLPCHQLVLTYGSAPCAGSFELRAI